MVCIGYARRSKATSEDARDGRRVVSLDTQAEKIRSYATAQGWTLAEIVTDDGVSGGRRERLGRIANRVKVTHAGAVIVYTLDRYARDVSGLLDSLRSLNRRGVELHATDRGRIDTGTASGFLMTSIEGVVSEHYRRVVGEKSKHALAKLRAEGRRISRWPPYGFRHDDTGNLITEPTEQQALAAIAGLVHAGLSLRALAAKLEAQGFLARSGRPFSVSTLAVLLRRCP